MDKSFQVREVAAGAFYLLAYMQHMAKTARLESVRILFESFSEQQRERMRWAGQSQSNMATVPVEVESSCWQTRDGSRAKGEVDHWVKLQ